MKEYWNKIPSNVQRIIKTLAQVVGGVVVAGLYDWGMDGAIVFEDYIFGPGGVVVLATTVLAGLMNLSAKPDVPAE